MSFSGDRNIVYYGTRTVKRYLGSRKGKRFDVFVLCIIIGKLRMFLRRNSKNGGQLHDYTHNRHFRLQ